MWLVAAILDSIALHHRAGFKPFTHLLTLSVSFTYSTEVLLPAATCQVLSWRLIALQRS